MTVEKELQRLRVLPAIAHVYKILSTDLPANVRYHTFAHTEDVVGEAILFALEDGIEERDRELIAVAAAFHDIGFIRSMTDNEGIGAEMASESLRALGGYREDEIAAIATMIRDTKVLLVDGAPRQVPTTPLSPYLLDADVSNLGRRDFFEKAELVREEINFKDRTVFLQGVLVFMTAQAWYSPAAKRLRGAQKEENLKALQEMVRLGSR